VDDALANVCLDRSIDLPGVQLRFQDWPGRGVPLVHFALDSDLGPRLAAAFAPRHRVLSVWPRPDVAYQVHAQHLADFLHAFGFERPLLIAEGAGCIAPLLVAAWHADLLGAVLLVAPSLQGARGLRECPPDWRELEQMVYCPLAQRDTFSVEAIEELLLRAAG
jgi:hypothetical protein